jgi:hypothetical protein
VMNNVWFKYRQGTKLTGGLPVVRPKSELGFFVCT